LVDDHSLAAEFVRDLFYLTVVLDVVDGLGSLQVEFETLLRLKLLKGEDEFVDVLENLGLVDLD